MRALSNQQILSLALQDPHCPHVLVTGPSGAGKSFLLENSLSPQYTYALLDYTNIRTLADFIGYFESVQKDNTTIVVLDRIENCLPTTQASFLLYLDTLRAERKAPIQLIMTSARPVGELRDYRTTLLQGLYDRISEVVIALPSIEEMGNVYTAFIEIWQNYNAAFPLPNVADLRPWLTKTAPIMKGNYRDLLKVVHRWQLYKKTDISDDLIFTHIKHEFADFGYGVTPYNKTGYFSY